jgi:hypothetical protein
MPENPYSGMLNIWREEARGQIPTSFLFGEVKAVSPLVITVSKTNQSGNSLIKNATIGELKAGDSVLIIPLESNQRFLILCKVVSA